MADRLPGPRARPSSKEHYRASVYMAAVCRCFPGRLPKGGDRVPANEEVERCSKWLNAEIELLRPTLIIPIGRLAITRFTSYKRLSEVVGREIALDLGYGEVSLIPLPHPSGLNTWIHSESGKQLLAAALDLIGQRPEWQRLIRSKIMEGRTGQSTPPVSA